MRCPPRLQTGESNDRPLTMHVSICVGCTSTARMLNRGPQKRGVPCTAGPAALASWSVCRQQRKLPSTTLARCKAKRPYLNR